MHILSPETDNCPSWISRRERMTVENISWSISTKECCRPRRGLNPGPPGLKSDGTSGWATEAGKSLHMQQFSLPMPLSTSFGGIWFSKQPGPEVIKVFSCSTQLSTKFSLLKNMKLAFSYLLAEKMSCSAMFSKKEFAVVSNLRFISRTKFMLSWGEHEKFL